MEPRRRWRPTHSGVAVWRVAKRTNVATLSSESPEWQGSKGLFPVQLREAQKVAEREPTLLQLRIRNGRHNGDLIDQGPERTRDNSVETCPVELGQNPREILQGSAGAHREIELTRN